jgi:hypothetical protein
MRENCKQSRSNHHAESGGIWRKVSRSICSQAQRKEATMAKRKTKKKRKIYLSAQEIQAKILRLH